MSHTTEERYRFLKDLLIEKGVLTNQRYNNGTWTLQGIYGTDDSGLRGAGRTPEEAISNAMLAQELTPTQQLKYWQETIQNLPLEEASEWFLTYFNGKFSAMERALLKSWGIEQPVIDALDPKWQEENRVHNWRNYASDALKALWPSLTPLQRVVIAHNLDQQADREHWD